jgi:hypothetical protein
LIENYIKNFADNYLKGRGLFLCGSHGRGKSMVACFIAKFVATKMNPYSFEQKIKYIVAYSQLDNIMSLIIHDKQKANYFIQKPDLLIIDNIGEEFGRNDNKFSKAASEYVEISEKTFNTIVNSLRVAYELTNPVIDSILSEEYKLFKNLDKSMECFGNNNERFKEIKNHYDNPNINKENITYDPTKYMAEKGLMKKLSMRKMTTTRLLPTKKAGSLNSTDIKFTNRRMSVFSKPNDKNVEYLGIENYENIYVNSRMTNSFGEIKNEKLTEFYEFEDDFD